MKCSWPAGCDEQATRGRLCLCIKHRDENADNKAREHNARGTARKQAWRAANPVLCREPGCKNPVIGKSHRCPECKQKVREAEYEGRDRDAEKVKVKRGAENAIYIVPDKPKKRKAVVPIMTAEEQNRIDKEIADKLNQRCGYGHGPVKRYSAEERATLAAQITPIENIRHRANVGYYDNYMMGV